MTPANRIKTLLLSLSLVAGGAFSAAADEIVVYKLTESYRATRYFTPSDFPEVDTPGGRSRSSERSTGYVILNKTTGNFRQVFYYKTYSQQVGGRKTTEKRIKSSSGDHTPAVFFETDIAARTNYLVLSLFGTGNGLNFEHSEDPSSLSSSVQIETLVGKVKLQKIKTKLLGVVECDTPSVISGSIAEESYAKDSPDDDSHFTSIGKKSLRLDKQRTRDFIELGGGDLDDAQQSVEDYLISKGYEFPNTM